MSLAGDPSNLPEFLLARIAEDEETARLAGCYGEVWHNGGDGAWEDSIAVVSSDGALARSGRGVGEVSLHAVLQVLTWDPARVLAECEAKRRIVAAFLDAERAVATYDHAHPTDAYWQEWGNRHALALAVELLGVPYADHPDYQPEWAPETVTA